LPLHRFYAIIHIKDGGHMQKNNKNLIRGIFVVVGGFTVGISAGHLDTAAGMILFGVGVLFIVLPHLLIKE